MPDAKKFSLSFRPSNYWGPQKVETHFGARAKGEFNKQQTMTRLKKIGKKQAGPGGIKTNPETTNQVVSPAFLMGGKYLPELRANEVEIARIIKKSTTLDVVSIRARQTKNRIVYNIVDEYPEYDPDYYLTKRTSVNSLRLSELIEMIDSAVEDGLVGSGRNSHHSQGFPAEEVYDFETAASVYYADLWGWYNEVNKEWLSKMQNSD
ncbi:hypothetical protein N9U06_01135 [Gammaproteobacteria bacterium]|nr:hypothetical protein [Gammaproteobacteria bacterium]